MSAQGWLGRARVQRQCERGGAAAARARAGSRGRACARAPVWALPGGGVRGELGAGLSGARAGRAGREREGERGRADWGARPVRVASGARGVLGPAQRGGWWRGRAVPSRRRGRGERERRGRRGQARRVGERREEGRGKGKEKKIERKWEKEKKRKRRGEKREKERGGEGSVPGSRHRSRSLSATLGVRARENATHGSRKNRVSDTGVGRSGGTGRIPEDWG